MVKTEAEIRETAVVRILAGVSGRSLAVMVGMTMGAVDALTARQAEYDPGAAPLQPIVVGVSGGAMAAAAVAVRMSRDRARQIAVDHPPGMSWAKGVFAVCSPNGRCIPIPGSANSHTPLSATGRSPTSPSPRNCANSSRRRSHRR